MVKSYADHVSRVIAELRKSRNLSLDDMGSLINVSGRTVRRWEKGEVSPTLDDLSRICSAFSISMEEFINKELEAETDAEPRVIDAITSEKQTAAGPAVYAGLLILHVVCAGAIVLCQDTLLLSQSMAPFVSVFYALSIFALLIIYRKDRLFPIVILTFSIILLSNLIIWYHSHRYMELQSIVYSVYKDVWLMLINGPVFGLSRYTYDPLAWLNGGFYIYPVWMICSAGFILHSFLKNQFEMDKSFFNISHIIIGVLMLITVIAIPYASFTYFSSPSYRTFFYDRHALFIMTTTAIGLIYFDLRENRHPSIRRWFHFITAILVYMIVYETCYINPANEYMQYWHRMPGYYIGRVLPILCAILQIVEDIIQLVRKEKES